MYNNKSSSNHCQNKKTVAAKDDKFTFESPVINYEENDVVSDLVVDIDDDICSSLFTTINDLDFEQTTDGDKTDDEAISASHGEQDSIQDYEKCAKKNVEEYVDNVMTEDGDNNEAQKETRP
jgi:rubrerythrin